MLNWEQNVHPLHRHESSRRPAPQQPEFLFQNPQSPQQV